MNDKMNDKVIEVLEDENTSEEEKELKLAKIIEQDFLHEEVHSGDVEDIIKAEDEKILKHLQMMQANGNAATSRVARYIEGKQKGLTKMKAALRAGYSATTSRVPQMIERTQVYKEQMKSITTGTVGIIGRMIDEIQKRDLDKVGTKDLVVSVEKMSKFALNLADIEDKADKMQRRKLGDIVDVG